MKNHVYSLLSRQTGNRANWNRQLHGIFDQNGLKFDTSFSWRRLMDQHFDPEKAFRTWLRRTPAEELVKLN
jgi:hypothetical protein